jgi:single-strand DNA-binding protein
MNVWSFTGRLGADAEVKQVRDSAVAEFRCAVASGYGDREQTTWVRCNLWGKRGESLAPYLTKGQQVAVSGELTNREYERNDGGTGYSLEVRVNDLTLVGGKQTQKETPPAQEARTGDAFEDTDIPF